MKKVTVFVGSARKKHTHEAARKFLDALERLGDVQGEIVTLRDYQVGTCEGCCTCFLKGEEFCPMRDDDRDRLIGKMTSSDGVVFASPVYSFQVPALLKIFLDRLGFVFHRPRFFGKTFTSIVVQGIYGGAKVVKYLDFVGGGLGFNTVKGSCLQSLEPMTEKAQRRNSALLTRQARRFHERLMKPAYAAPNLLKLLIFRMARTSIHLMLNENYRDYTYYRDQGWFKSDYYYPTRLGAFKKATGRLFDALETRMVRGR